MSGKIYLPIVDNGMQLVRSSYTLCLLNAMHRRPIAVEKISYPYPLGAMDIITNHFLKTDCERMLIIDGDMVFGRHDVDMILEHDADMVGAVYAKKVVGCELVMSALTDEWDNSENPLMEVEWVGRGFLNIHRRVFEAMHPCETYQLGGETLNAYWESMPGGHSEDRGLCLKWRRMGGKVYVDKRVTLGHEGSTVFPIHGTYKINPTIGTIAS